MSLNLKYAPEKIDNAEFHRIREWYNTFNAVIRGELTDGSYNLNSASERKELRRKASKFANSVHGSIKKPLYETFARTRGY